MYEFGVHQEVQTANCQAITFAKNLLSSSERSYALQVLSCALGRSALGLYSHREPITAHG
jgi:hypothetical protein